MSHLYDENRDNLVSQSSWTYNERNSPNSISLTLADQNNLLSASVGNLLKMLMSEWKGSDGTFRKCDYEKERISNTSSVAKMKRV
jgi:hypothetical protein